MTARRAARRLMPRAEAAIYCGLSETVFDSLRAAGVIPPPLRWPGVSKLLFDSRRLDEAIDALAEPADASKDDWSMA